MERFRLFSDGEVDEVLHVDAADAVQVFHVARLHDDSPTYGLVFRYCRHSAAGVRR
jgi:hypothetical protein